MPIITAISEFVSFIKVVDQALKLLDDLRNAPAELHATRRLVNGLAIALQSIRSDVIENPNSIVNTPNSLLSEKRAKLVELANNCQKSLQRVEKLVRKYKGPDNIWKRWRWTRDDKQKVAEIHSDLMVTTLTLNTYLHKLGIDALGRIEQLVERILLINIQQNSPRPQLKRRTTIETRRMRKNFGRSFFVSLFISRLVAKWKLAKAARLQRRPTLKRRNTRKSGILKTPLRSCPKKTELMNDYSKILLEEPSIAARLDERYECYIVSGGHAMLTSYLKQHKIERGQLQLAEMAQCFNETGPSSDRDVGSSNQFVKEFLKWRNSQVDVKRGKSKRKWIFAAGRLESRKATSHGKTLTMEKIMVIIKR
jgi:hypothetical protein